MAETLETAEPLTLNERRLDAASLTVTVGVGIYAALWVLKKGGHFPGPGAMPNVGSISTPNRVSTGILNQYGQQITRPLPIPRPTHMPQISPDAHIAIVMGAAAMGAADFERSREQNQFFTVASSLLRLPGRILRHITAAQTRVAEELVSEQKQKMLNYFNPTNIVNNLTLGWDANGHLVPGHTIYAKEVLTGVITELFVPLIKTTVHDVNDHVGIVKVGSVRPGGTVAHFYPLDHRFEGFDIPGEHYTTCLINGIKYQLKNKLDADILYAYQVYALGHHDDLPKLLEYRETDELLVEGEDIIKVIAFDRLVPGFDRDSLRQFISDFHNEDGHSRRLVQNRLGDDVLQLEYFSQLMHTCLESLNAGGPLIGTFGLLGSNYVFSLDLIP